MYMDCTPQTLTCKQRRAINANGLTIIIASAIHYASSITADIYIYIYAVI